MEMKRWIGQAGQGALAASAFAISTSAFAMPPTAAMWDNGCAACHGTLGASAGPTMPSLAGQSKEAIVAAMKSFKTGERPSVVMGRLAKGYTDADFAIMGNFFAGQKLHITQQTLDPMRVAKGASLQASKCGGCHTENGKVNNDDAPAMASQWLPYLRMQMALYVEGKRKTPGMSEAIKKLSADDLESLLQFYASVK